MLEEERQARLAEGALGEAVLREVQDTQTLLGEVCCMLCVVRRRVLCVACCALLCAFLCAVRGVLCVVVGVFFYEFQVSAQEVFPIYAAPIPNRTVTAGWSTKPSRPWSAAIVVSAIGCSGSLGRSLRE